MNSRSGLMNAKLENINRPRRMLVGAAAATAAVAQLGMLGAAAAQAAPKAGQLSVAKLDSNASFAAIKQINAGTLSVGFAEAGPADGAPVILLHGWPYDIYSFVDVAPLLAAAGYRVIIPWLR